MFDIPVRCFTLMWPMWWTGCWIPGTYLSRTIKSSHSETSGNSEYGFACFLFTYCLCYTGGPHHQTVQRVQGQGFQVWWDGGSASWRPQEAAESCPWSARLGWWRCWHGCKWILHCVRMKGRGTGCKFSIFLQSYSWAIIWSGLLSPWHTVCICFKSLIFSVLFCAVTNICWRKMF